LHCLFPGQIHGYIYCQYKWSIVSMQTSIKRWTWFLYRRVVKVSTMPEWGKLCNTRWHAVVGIVCVAWVLPFQHLVYSMQSRLYATHSSVQHGRTMLSSGCKYKHIGLQHDKYWHAMSERVRIKKQCCGSCFIADFNFFLVPGTLERFV
jgi:hypothetical protein